MQPALSLFRFLRFLLPVLALLLAMPAQAELKRLVITGSQPSFLKAEEAFQLQTQESASGLQLKFHITPNYYLYLDRFHFLAEGAAADSLIIGQPTFSLPAEEKDDANFGRVQIFHHDVTVTLPLTGHGQVKIVWQGCADAGLCYPPQDQLVSFGAAPSTTSSTASPTTPATISAEPVAAKTIIATSPALTSPASVITTPITTAEPAPETRSRLVQLFLMFALGLGLAFTPCVLPMLPILAGIIARQHTRSALRGFLLALSYVLGVATVYALTGFVVGFFGEKINLPSLFQQPVVLGVFALLFFALALSLFGLFELRLPSTVQTRFDNMSRRQKSGALIGTFFVGIFSALVVSPCVSAPLFGVLLHISTTGDALFGALSLFWMAIGMGVPLLILGATEGRLLPKAGAWMNEVKNLFGFLLMFVAAELLTRLLPAPAALALYGICTAAIGFWLWQLYQRTNGLGLLLRSLAFCTLVYAAALIAGAASGGDDPLKPLATLSSGQSHAAKATEFVRIKNNADLDREVAAAKAKGQAVMLDFYADWCVSCKIMERHVFRDPRVAPHLQNMRLLQADITTNNADDRELLKRFSLFGPPALIFFDKNGEEISTARLVGETDSNGFLTHLAQSGW
jgi:thiol:disulfide interchange protein DsbD